MFMAEPSTSNTAGWVVDHFQNAVADGGRFVPGQTVGIGWRALRAIQRDDRTLGLEERVGEDVWEDHADRTLGDLWYQVEAAAKVGLPEAPDSMAEDHLAAIQPCVFEASTLVL